jgi:hypothetical protein
VEIRLQCFSLYFYNLLWLIGRGGATIPLIVGELPKGFFMWIKTKNGDYANLNFVCLLQHDKEEWLIYETGAEGFCRSIDDETAERLIDIISKDLV